MALLLAAYYVLPVGSSSSKGMAIRAVIAGVIVIAVLVWQVRAVLDSVRPVVRAAEALAVVVTLSIVIFASTYLSISGRDPRAFSEPLDRTGALYFTMTTLSTVGFGDISALTNGARIAVMLQIVLNIVGIGVAVKLITTSARYRVRNREVS